MFRCFGKYFFLFVRKIYIKSIECKILSFAHNYNISFYISIIHNLQIKKSLSNYLHKNIGIVVIEKYTYFTSIYLQSNYRNDQSQNVIGRKETWKSMKFMRKHLL